LSNNYLISTLSGKTTYFSVYTAISDMSSF
jgi:hypothetical protein